MQALENYVAIFTVQGKFMTLLPLKTIEQYLANSNFIRTHKSYLVAIGKITTIENHEIKIEEHNIPISRNFRDSVLQMVLNEKVLRKR